MGGAIGTAMISAAASWKKSAEPVEHLDEGAEE